MIPEDITFPGLELIPGLRPVPNAAEPAFLVLDGNCPIVISAPHSGTPATTPAGAKTFGERRDDPAVSGSFNSSDDVSTLAIAFAVVRTLASMGFVPHAAINLVSRRWMDLNRSWNGQQMWQDASGTYRPGDETKTADEFPRVVEFDRFRRSYYQDFHDTLRGFTESLHPDGWLFDVHGTSLSGLGDGFTLQIVTTLGFTARRDFVYDNASNLHAALVDGGFVVHPPVRDPGQEFSSFSPAGAASLNLISGSRYGAQGPPANRADLPEPGPVVPGPEQRRVHGVQFEMDGSIRRDRSAEQLEAVGINLANAITGFLLDNGVLTSSGTPQDGRNGVLVYALMG